MYPHGYCCYFTLKRINEQRKLPWMSGAGVMHAAIAHENTFAQNITFDVNPGEVFIATRGLLFFNHNIQCVPNVFLQSFTSSDTGALNTIGALAALRDSGATGEAPIIASGAAEVKASPQMKFASDQACLNRCGFPETAGGAWRWPGRPPRRL
jgi:hypothetical protein